ncbi:MAG: hypothetical protein EXR72_20200 [Myxococcales bacterium]|nr:hypothetical protein [Myxococcales bacterium]
MFVHGFDPLSGVIWVRGIALGPQGERELRLILDTGTPVTVLNTAAADDRGDSARMATERTHLIGVDGVQAGYRLSRDRLDVLGFSIDGCGLLCHDFDDRLNVHGLIGMDPLAGRLVTIDGLQGLLTVEP